MACYVSAGLSGLNLVIGVIFLTEAKPRGNQAREAAASLTAAEGGTARDEEGAGTQVAAEDSRGAAASRLQARQSSVDTGLDYIPWSAGLLFGAGFLFMLGFASFESVTGYYLMDMYFPGDQVASGQFYGALFTVAGVTMFLVAVFVYKPMLKCFGENLTIVIGGVFRTLGFVGMALAPTPFWFAVSAVFQVSGGNLISPTTSSLLTTICSKNIYGRALGYQQAFRAIARIFAPMIFGLLVRSFRQAHHLLDQRRHQRSGRADDPLRAAAQRRAHLRGGGRQRFLHGASDLRPALPRRQRAPPDLAAAAVRQGVRTRIHGPGHQHADCPRG